MRRVELKKLRWLNRTAVCALALTGLSVATMTRTYCTGNEIKPLEKEPETAIVAVSYLANRGAAKPQEPDIVPLEDVEPMPKYTEAELEALALVIYQEAGSDACSDATRYMVGEVVLNRIASDLFPNTMYEVLTQEAQYGRLAWDGLIWPERAGNPGEKHAVERAYETARKLLDGDVSRLLPEDTIFQAEFVQGSEVIAFSDGMYFCRR